MQKISLISLLFVFVSGLWLGSVRAVTRRAIAGIINAFPLAPASLSPLKEPFQEGESLTIYSDMSIVSLARLHCNYFVINTLVT